MRIVSPLLLALVSAFVLAPGPVACADEPAVAVQAEPAAELAEALLGPEGPARAAAEARLVAADADLLRGVVQALRRRAAAPTPARSSPEALDLEPLRNPAAVWAASGEGQPVVRLETRVVRATPAAAAALLRAGFLDAARVRSYAPQAFAAWMTSCSAARGVEVLTAPSIAAYSGQRATVQVLKQVSYVEDFEVETSTAAHIASPVIQTVSEGLLMDIEATALPQGVRVEADLKLAQLVRPMAEYRTTLAASTQPVTIQLPELAWGGAQRTLMLAPGRPTLLADLPSPVNGDARRVLVFLTARVEPAPAAPPAHPAPAGPAAPGAPPSVK